MTLRKLHGISAIFITLYAIAHLANQLAGIVSIETHIAFMQNFRSLYRTPIIEGILLAAVAFQIVSGLRFAINGWKTRQGITPWLQTGSGLYLAFFLLNHVGTVLFGRTVLDLDTNFYFVAAGFYAHPFQFFFAPYYFFAVLALLTHLGCALYWQLQSRPSLVQQTLIALPMALGFMMGAAIVLMLSGRFYPIEIPPEYKAPFEQLTGF